MAVRNGVLGRAVTVNPNDVFTLFTVPSTETRIVKDVHLYNGAAVPSTITVYLTDSTLAQTLVFWNISLPAKQTQNVPGFFAAAPGDLCKFTADQGGVFCWVSGAALAGHI